MGGWAWTAWGVATGLLVACASPVPRFPTAETDGATSTSSTGEPDDLSTSDGGSNGTSIDDGRSESTSTTDGGATTSDTGTDTMLPGDATTTGALPGDPGPCPGGDGDCPMGQNCVQFGDMMGSEVASVCGDPCSVRQPCEPGAGMMNAPICVDQAGGSTCVLSCGDDECPDQMVCAMSMVGLLCVWPG